MSETVPPAEAQPKPTAPAERDSPLRLFLGLFVVPLLVVLLCVGVFVGFGWIAYDRQTITDYLNDLQSGWKPRRAQAAYELSKILLADPDALREEPGAQAELRRLFAAADDEVLRRYLALVLGRARDSEAAPILAGALAGADAQSRVYFLLALGETGDPRASSPLLEALADGDPGIRKTAAFSLGALGDSIAVGALEPLLADPVADVRWNSALALARLGSAAGVGVLREMLDRSVTSAVAGITPEQQEEAMVSAVKALGAVGGPEARDLLARLADEDASLKVRQAAIQARDSLPSSP